MFEGMSTLEQLGYHFNKDGILLKDRTRFQFTNQQDYEILGEAITQEIYKLLQERCGLKKVPLHPPGKPEPAENLSFIFHSPNYASKETLLVLIHGSGVVRAGQWARKLIINENLECGSQMPYIDRAHANGWGVVVFNTNENERNGRKLKYSENSEEHALNAWRAFVEHSRAKKILVVAHSRGGPDFEKCLTEFGEDPRILAACFTDSPSMKLPEKCFKRNVPIFAVNFVIGGPIDDEDYKIEELNTNDIQCLWAGTDIHELTSHVAFDAVFYILEKGINYGNYKEVFEEAKKLVVNSNEDDESTDDEEILEPPIPEHLQNTDHFEGVSEEVLRAREEEEARRLERREEALREIERQRQQFLMEEDLLEDEDEDED